MAVTLQDVAEKAGVSKITVSRVISGKNYVSTDKEARVRAAIKELNYVPNQVASSLRSRQTSTIALLLPDITNPYWTTVARGVEDEAGRQGFGVFLCNTDESPTKEAQYLDLAVRRRVDGIILGPTPGSAPLLQQLTHQQIKFALIDRTVEGIVTDVVRGDSYSGAFSLTMHLLATGFERVAFIGGPLTTSTGLDRLNGYRAAVAASGRTTDPTLIKIGSYSQQSGYRSIGELLDFSHPPDSVLTGNNQITIGTLIALDRRGKTVPQDISLASFDDISAINFPTPFLTAAIQPAYRIGQLGAERLLAQITGGATDYHDIILPVQTVVRRSCGCTPQSRDNDELRLDGGAILSEYISTRKHQ